ncbi:cytosolic Fe-S cluster assembly factor cfd1 [Pichia californica]|uniref:Cytosolic Fe-S cluster assembly factor cfd1 n=1 Tax=Pichia californica TaxID=460514 RepID=A0A9P6WQB7_9ASCO|nr:cytosolic Fe-S cluster assembly factor cfd1 [[Candida] californica]KAG0690307.1 cytosolic Fe-S cluster assembly factor cfd1 [[Candida] californica]
MSESEKPFSLNRVKNVILVLSGKGGVGKSSVTTQLALTLASQNLKIGILDIDLTGPSLPRMFGIEDHKIHQSEQGWIPVHAPVKTGDNTLNMKLMSLGFLLNNRGDAIVWRGPKKTGMIRQFFKDVIWGELDYLIIDTPPGTSDEHIAIAEELNKCPELIYGAVIVTTPQLVSINDVKKEINYCEKANFRILGIVENMSGFVCPYCAECTNIFSKGGGEKLALETNLPFLGAIPIDPLFVDMIENQVIKKKENNETLVELYQHSNMYPLFQSVVEQILSLGKE